MFLKDFSQEIEIPLWIIRGSDFVKHFYVTILLRDKVEILVYPELWNDMKILDF